MKTKEEIEEIFRRNPNTTWPDGWREFKDTKGDRDLPSDIGYAAVQHAYRLFPSMGYQWNYAWADYVIENWKE